MENTKKYQNLNEFTIMERITVIILTLMFIIPIAFVFLAALVPGGMLISEGLGVFKKLSLVNFSILFQIPFFQSFVKTASLCLLTTLFCISMGMVFANMIFEQKKSIQRVMKLLLTIWTLLAYPLVLYAMGNDWFNWSIFENDWAIVSVYSWICLPLCALVLTIRMGAYPVAFLEMEKVDALSYFAKVYVRTKFLSRVIVILSGYCLIIIWNDLSIADMWISREEPWTMVQMLKYLVVNRQVNLGEIWAVFSVFFVILFASVFLLKPVIQKNIRETDMG